MSYLLSVIIPHYNCIDGLYRLLGSIPICEDIQVIIVDDNSPVMIPQDIKERKNTVVLDNYTKKNSAGTCRNIGLEKAQGMWVLFADSDDYYVPNWYECIEKYFTTENDIVFFIPTSIQLDTGKKDTRHVAYEKLLREYIERPTKRNLTKVKYNYYVPHSKLIRRDFIEENELYFDNTLVSNDLMFSTVAGHKSKKVEVSADTIYCITRSKGSLTTNVNKKNYDIRHKVAIRRASYLFEHLEKDENAYVGLDILGIRFLISDIKKGMGMSYLFQDLKELKKAKVPLFTWEILNPVTLCKYFVEKVQESTKYKLDTRYKSN